MFYGGALLSRRRNSLFPFRSLGNLLMLLGILALWGRVRDPMRGPVNFPQVCKYLRAVPTADPAAAAAVNPAAN